MGEVAKLETRELTPMKEVEKHIADMGQRLKSVLPSHIDPAKFQRVAMTAIQMNPALINAGRQSLYTALTRAATDGLLPDGREGALTIAKTKVKRNGREEYVDMVVWMPMVAGVLKKVRQSGEIRSWIAKAVYERDEFDILYGDDDRIHHRPHEGEDPGKIRGAYSIVTFKDGTKSRDYMPWWRIAKAKAVAKTKFVWDAWPDEMSVKTVIRHHAKLLPQSTDIEALFERDETTQAELLGNAAAMLTRQPVITEAEGRALLAASIGAEDDVASDQFDVEQETQPPAMAEEAAGHVPHVEPAEVAAAGSEAALFDAPDYVEQAASLDARYRDCSDMDSLRQLWADTAAERRAIISADGSYKDVFAKVIAREKARLEGEMS